MILPLYLAMTAAEISACPVLPERIAYMACHFSSYGTGLSNVPEDLPPGSVVILNDRIPVAGHDPDRISRELATLCERVQADGLLLDLQRPAEPLTLRIVRRILDRAVCPVAVSDLYAADLDCPVFLSAPPLHVAMIDHIRPWDGRELWLEAAPDGCRCTVTEQGSRIHSCMPEPLPLPCPELFCHYRIQEEPEQLIIELSRCREDLDSLLAASGASRAIGLYQQLRAELFMNFPGHPEEKT